MHQEISQRHKVSFIKLATYVFCGAFLLIIINTLLYDYHLDSSITDVLMLALIGVAGYNFIKQNRVSYRYNLIDDEFFIHEIIGSREKVVMSIHMDQVLRFAPVTDARYQVDKHKEYETKRKLYNCVNTCNRYYMVYKEADKKNYVTLQPSDHMILLIKNRLQNL